MTDRRPPAAFTLIELLVVITIIVVLLAMLTPALDQAIYQAELAKCMGNLKVVGTGVMVYSCGNRRHYPYRGLPENQGVKPVHIFNGENVVSPKDTYDDRRILRPYFSIKQTLLDPMCLKVDYDTTASSSAVEISYPLWFGFRYKTSPHAGRGMYKVGDRFTFTNDDTSPHVGTETYSFNVLASDMDVVSLENFGNFTHSSHPDKTGTRFAVAVQDINAVNGALPAFGLTITTSRWDGPNCRRGPLDMNHAYDDGSVQRLTDVTLLPNSNGNLVVDGRGQRMVAVDEYGDDAVGKGSDYYIPPAH